MHVLVYGIVVKWTKYITILSLLFWLVANDFVHCALSIKCSTFAFNIEKKSTHTCTGRHTHAPIHGRCHGFHDMLDLKCRAFHSIGRSNSLDLALWCLYGRSFFVLNSPSFYFKKLKNKLGKKLKKESNNFSNKTNDLFKKNLLDFYWTFKEIRIPNIQTYTFQTHHRRVWIFFQFYTCQAFHVQQQQ